MRKSNILAPTLWRTCRILANRTRLRVLADLVKHPNQPVSDIAARLRLSMPVASRYLRDLNARGLIDARRTGRWVYYRTDANLSVRGAGSLLRALKHTFIVERNPVETIYRQATAFTHPRRLAILRALQFREHTRTSLRNTTGMPQSALDRHIFKLKSRGFIAIAKNQYVLSVPRNAFGATLLSLTFAS